MDRSSALLRYVVLMWLVGSWSVAPTLAQEEDIPEPEPTAQEEVYRAGLAIFRTRRKRRAEFVPVPIPRTTNYRIEVELDPDSKTLEGRQTITWQNVQEQPTDTLWFHLYWNAWQNNRSTWMLEKP